jgi:DNA modification methylase
MKPRKFCAERTIGGKSTVTVMKPHYRRQVMSDKSETLGPNGEATIYIGDNRDTLREIPDGSVQCVVTSPPYYGLRDYGNDAQIGLEDTPEAFVQALVEVFREVRRVLRDDGTLWLNLGDSYVAARSYQVTDQKWRDVGNSKASVVPQGLKPKDLIGIPWRVAIALQADGWYLRQDIIWHKPNPMPESVTDRCTKAHEYLFLLTKSARYYYDAEAVKERAEQAGRVRSDRMGGNKYVEGIKHSDGGVFTGSETRNCRSVWTVATQPYSGAHFATFPPKLIEPCILAGSKPGDTVLDPFGGSGTTAGVALEHGRKAILCELSEEYAELIPERINSITDALIQRKLFEEATR